MALEEFSVVMKARELAQMTNPTVIPVPVEAYVERAGMILKIDDTLSENEPGWSFENKGKKYICVNGNDSQERQRFTICHELAHIVLGLPSEHQEVPSFSYVKRSLNEILCDIFAAELLLPYRLFQPMAEKEPIGLASIDSLAQDFNASFTATGSRFAAVLKVPCAFVLSEKGKVRYAARSTMLREAGAWIAPRIEIPAVSLSARLRAGSTCNSAEEIDADEWFQDWERGGTLLEEARHLEHWDQTLSLLWFEDEAIPAPKGNDWKDTGQSEEDAELLPELDGILRWPGKRRRR